MKITAKSAQELLVVLDETREKLFKDRKCTYPYTEWEHKRAQVKQRLHRLPEYIREAVVTINREEQRMGRPPKLDLEKESESLCARPTPLQVQSRHGGSLRVLSAPIWG